MAWDLKPDRPIYTQLVEHIQLMIYSGAYPLGSRLPSVRDLAQEAAVNPNTMQRALAKLEEDGLIITHRTSGRSVTEDAGIVERGKIQLAKEQISELLEKMRLLGFTPEELLAIMENMIKEMKKN